MEELIELINICSTKVKSDDEEISMQVEHDMENMNRKVTSPKAISLQEVCFALFFGFSLLFYPRSIPFWYTSNLIVISKQ